MLGRRGSQYLENEQTYDMQELLNLLLFIVMGPQVAYTATSLRTYSGIPQFIHLVELLFSIGSGQRIPISDKEIRDGLDELSLLLEKRVDENSNLTNPQKYLAKQENKCLLNGCSRY